MNKTKEEILQPHISTYQSDNGESDFDFIWPENASRAMDEYTTHLTDQIKSMEEENEELKEWKSIALFTNSKWDKLRDFCQEKSLGNVGDNYPDIIMEYIIKLESKEEEVSFMNYCYDNNWKWYKSTNCFYRANENIRYKELYEIFKNK